MLSLSEMSFQSFLWQCLANLKLSYVSKLRAHSEVGKVMAFLNCTPVMTNNFMLVVVEL